MGFEPRQLPSGAKLLCDQLNAPARLVAHLRLVHDAAVEITDGLNSTFPDLAFDRDAVLFGAATHDLGKVLHPNELTGPGAEHEIDGPSLLESHGVPSELARFAKTHAGWSSRLPLEDLLVGLADATWKGQRIDDLESQVVERIADQANVEAWKAFEKLDAILEDVASRGDERLAWQADS